MPNCLILRAKDDALQTAKLLSERGFETIIEPLFVVEKLPQDVVDEAFYNAVGEDGYGVENNALNNVQALIITSANACDAIINLVFNKQIKIFAVGYKTALALVENGFSNIIYPQENSAFALKKLVENLEKNVGKILYFCGDDITLDFESELEPLGFKVNKILAYKVKWNKNFSAEFLQKVAQMQKENRIVDSILFFSQNSLKKFYLLAQNNNLLEYFSNSTLLCLSEKIALQAREFGFKNVGNFDLKNYG